MSTAAFKKTSSLNSVVFNCLLSLGSQGDLQEKKDKCGAALCMPVMSLECRASTSCSPKRERV